MSDMGGGGSERKGIQPGWRRGSLSGASITAAVGIALLFVGSSAAASLNATATSPPTKAPYSGVETGVFVGEISGCGISASFPVLPIFNLTTGIANGSVKATAHSCGTANSSVLAAEEPEFQSTAFSTTATGLHHIKANWVLTVSASIKATPGPAPQLAEAGFAVHFGIELENLTSGATTGGISFSSGVSDVISAGTYSHSFSKLHAADYLNITLAAGDEYAVVVIVEAVGFASVTAGTSSASASVNMGSGGKDAILSSITGA